MSKMYSEEEKIKYVETYKRSGETVSKFALKNGIAETTFRDWLRNDEDMKFGAINITPKIVTNTKRNITVFSSEDIRIELKEGFNKTFLKQLMEVLINVK